MKTLQMSSLKPGMSSFSDPQVPTGKIPFPARTLIETVAMHSHSNSSKVTSSQEDELNALKARDTYHRLGDQAVTQSLMHSTNLGTISC